MACGSLSLAGGGRAPHPRMAAGLPGLLGSGRRLAVLLAGPHPLEVGDKGGVPLRLLGPRVLLHLGHQERRAREPQKAVAREAAAGPRVADLVADALPEAGIEVPHVGRGPGQRGEPRRDDPLDTEHPAHVLDGCDEVGRNSVAPPLRRRGDEHDLGHVRGKGSEEGGRDGDGVGALVGPHDRAHHSAKVEPAAEARVPADHEREEVLARPEVLDGAKGALEQREGAGEDGRRAEAPREGVRGSLRLAGRLPPGEGEARRRAPRHLPPQRADVRGEPLGAHEGDRSARRKCVEPAAEVEAPCAADPPRQMARAPLRSAEAGTVPHAVALHAAQLWLRSAVCPGAVLRWRPLGGRLRSPLPLPRPGRVLGWRRASPRALPRGRGAPPELGGWRKLPLRAKRCGAPCQGSWRGLRALVLHRRSLPPPVGAHCPRSLAAFQQGGELVAPGGRPRSTLGGCV
mmetsp:Transcript_32422/g.76958  ORF Transcript_32422/g.76958 Transcript_32422/m.76958 type:complete len:458 (+) Transcript_32422:177-1550(+)